VRPCPLPLCSCWRERHTMHDRDPTEQFRAPAREPKPGTFHRPAHGFGMKRVREAAELRLRGPMTGEQKLGEGLRELPLSATQAPPHKGQGLTRPIRHLPKPGPRGPPTRARIARLLPEGGLQRIDHDRAWLHCCVLSEKAFLAFILSISALMLAI
jgi:hypothetical protein